MKKAQLFKEAAALSLTIALGAGVKNVQANETATKTQTPNVQSVRLDQHGPTVVLRWRANFRPGQYYQIYRSSGDYSSAKRLIGTTTHGVFVDRHPGKNVYQTAYTVKAVNKWTGKSSEVQTSFNKQIFGDNMKIFNPNDDSQKINATVKETFDKQKSPETSQFNNSRYGFYFMPGKYDQADPNHAYEMGYYTTVSGLGKTPTQTDLPNILVENYMKDENNNATQNFWTAIENVHLTNNKPQSGVQGQFNYATSQATPIRRMEVDRTTQLDWKSGWASGGYIADSNFKQKIGSMSQQQYYVRNTDLHNKWYNGDGSYNFTMQGNLNAPATNWSQTGSVSNVATTPVIKEKPFLYMGSNNRYQVFVPAQRRNAKGTSWTKDSMGPGRSLDLLSRFYIARSDRDNADSINAAIRRGKNIFFTPGVYHLNKSLQVNRPNTIILGTGMATLESDNQQGAIKVGNVPGVTLAGLIVDQGSQSETLVQVGNKYGRRFSSPANQTLLSDIFVRVGGPNTQQVPKVNKAVEINSDNVIGDDMWIWRGDHGSHIGWTQNEMQNGLVVNGNNVTMYGLFSEHGQKEQVLWNGENGRTYFYQSETPYDAQKQSDWMSHDGTVNGYASYKVADHVKRHEFTGSGVYGVFTMTNGAKIQAANSIEVPDTPGVIVNHASTKTFAGDGSIDNVINNHGGSTTDGQKHFITKYQNGQVE